MGEDSGEGEKDYTLKIPRSFLRGVSFAKSGFHENAIDIFAGPIYIPLFVSLVDFQANRGAVNAKDTFLPGNQIQR